MARILMTADQLRSPAPSNNGRVLLPTTTKQKTQDATPVKRGFFGTIADDIARPFAEGGVSEYNVAKSSLDLAMGNKDKAAQDVSASRTLPFFGKTQPAFSGDETTGQAARKMFGYGADVAATMVGGEGAVGVGEATLKGAVKTAAKEGLKTGAVLGAGQALGDDVKQGKSLGDTAVDTAVGGAAGAVLGAGTGAASGVAGNFLRDALSKPTKSVEELVTKTDEALSKQAETTAAEATDKTAKSASEKLRTEAQQKEPFVSLREKWAGVRPDIKNQIAGKQDKLQTYFNVAHARNSNVNVPTPLEFAVDKAKRTRDVVVGMMNDAGSSLGKFREKIKTYQIPMEKVQKVMSSFDDELDKLNLTVNNGKISYQSGRVKKVSDSEVSLLQKLRENLKVFRQTPTVDTGIQNRIAFDNNINFAKTGHEASSVVDPISRRVRSEIAQINRETVGKTEAKTIEEYSTMRQFLEEVSGYLDRRAGGEFMLKRVLSERGGEVRAMLNTLKKYTGVDLLDDATMAQISTDLIGNPDQKGLFRKEVMKAGMDAQDLLTGGKLNTAKWLFQKAGDVLADKEKMFLRAAR